MPGTCSRQLLLLQAAKNPVAGRAGSSVSQLLIIMRRQQVVRQLVEHVTCIVAAAAATRRHRHCRPGAFGAAPWCATLLHSLLLLLLLSIWLSWRVILAPVLVVCCMLRSLPYLAPCHFVSPMH